MSRQPIGPKRRVEELAIRGGRPAFATPLHVGSPNIGDRSRLTARLEQVLDRRRLTNNGPLVEELEDRISRLTEAKHCVATCNATTALMLVARAAGLEGEVIVPSFTFVATAHALRWQGITPVFCDIDPATHNIDPAGIERLITPRTTGIVGVHLWGRPCAVDTLAALAARRGLVLLFDAAHALACTYGGRPVGGLGNAEVLSFHATKLVNAFEGGAVVTNDDGLAGKVRLMRNFGFSAYDSVVSIGINGKMSEASAAMGLTSLDSLDEFLAVNRRNHASYVEALAGIPGVELLRYDECARSSYPYVVLEVDAEATGITRDELVGMLHAENVLARRYFYPGCHRVEPYRSERAKSAPGLPFTEQVAERVLALPTGTSVGPADIAAIASIVRVAVGCGREGARDPVRRGPPVETPAPLPGLRAEDEPLGLASGDLPIPS